MSTMKVSPAGIVIVVVEIPSIIIIYISVIVIVITIIRYLIVILPHIITQIHMSEFGSTIQYSNHYGRIPFL